MPPKTLNYEIDVEWTGDRGQGTKTYTGYDRDHRILVRGRPPIWASADPSFRGDAKRYSPEDLLVASLSGCHMLWYLHLCADAGIVVTAYRDRAHGRMELAPGGGREVLRPIQCCPPRDRRREVRVPVCEARGPSIHCSGAGRRRRDTP